MNDGNSLGATAQAYRDEMHQEAINRRAKQIGETTLMVEVMELRETLREYGSHLAGCGVTCWTSDHKCDCGYAAFQAKFSDALDEAARMQERVDELTKLLREVRDGNGCQPGYLNSLTMNRVELALAHPHSGASHD